MESSEKEPSPRYEVVHRVYDALVEARGDRRLPVPQLVLNNATRYVAWMDPQSSVIGLEEQAYEVCRRFGADSLRAVAALLAHELTHYYEKHGWTQKLASEQPSIASVRQLAGGETNPVYEAQADYLGGYLAYSAGFPTFGLMPALLDSIYRVYRLSDQLEGYPPLKERQQLAANSEKKVRELTEVFHMSNLLIAVEAYAIARDYLEFILRDFQSRELYNNLGVLSVLEALRYFDDGEVPLGLPLELDAESRLRDATRDPGVLTDRQRKRNELLQAAVRHFDRAAELDSGYPPALLNKGCALYLLNQQTDAAYFAGKARELAGQLGQVQQEADAGVLLGVIAWRRQDKKEALARFREAEKQGSVLASVNSAIVRDKPPVAVAVRREAGGIERIDDLRPEEFLADPNVDDQITIADNIILGVGRRPHSTIWLHYADDGQRYVFFLRTNPGYSAATARGIAVGDPRSKVEAAYQPAQREIGQANGRALVFPVHQLLVFLDKDDRVTGWALYRLKN